MLIRKYNAKQVAQQSSSDRWRTTAGSMGSQARQKFLVPAAASLRATGRSIQDAATKAVTATDNRVVKPVVHQAQSAAADTRHFFTHLVSHPAPVPRKQEHMCSCGTVHTCMSNCM